MIPGLMCIHELVVIDDETVRLNKKTGFMTWRRIINILSPGGETSPSTRPTYAVKDRDSRSFDAWPEVWSYSSLPKDDSDKSTRLCASFNPTNPRRTAAHCQ